MDAHDNVSDPPHKNPLNDEGLACADEIAAIESRRRRRRVMELDKSICMTRLSHRRLILRMQAASSDDLLNDPVRLYGGTKHSVETGRAVDWD